MSYSRIPELARKYKCEMMDIRTPWKKYAADNNYPWSEMLSDDIHLNSRGEYLMGALISRYLAYKPKFATDPYGLVKTYEIGKDVNFVNGVLSLPFDGNRVDIIPSSTGSMNLSADVFIDDKKPSQFPGSYAFSRPNDSTYVPGYFSRDAENKALRIDWPWQVGSVKTITSNIPITQVEDWEITINSFNADKSAFQFSLKGSVTGNDGTGNSGSDFISNSGKVVIKKADWFITQAMRDAYKITINPGFKIKWTVMPLFKDTYSPQPIADATKENAITVAQGFTNASHTLKLVASGTGTMPIKAIRVYRPYWNRPLTTAVVSEIEDALSIYPNPTSDFLNINLSESNKEIQEVTIINSLGEEVSKGNPQVQQTSLQFDLTSLPPGVYIAMVKSANVRVSKKFTIIR